MNAFLKVIGMCAVVVAISAWAGETVEIAPAYAPIVNASNQRREAALRQLSTWRATREALAKEQKLIEKNIAQFAAKLDVAKDAQIHALSARIKSLEENTRKLETSLKEMSFASFTTLAQMARYDQASDELKAARQSIELAKEEFGTLTRKLVRRDLQAALLVDKWETLNVQIIAAVNEAALAQVRRDDALRNEGGLLNSLKPLPAEKHAAKMEFFSVPVPQLPDAAGRVAQFKRRHSEEALRQLGERFFSQMTLNGDGLQDVSALARAGRYSDALDAYKRYFFRKILGSNEANEALEDGANDDEGVAGESTQSAIAFRPPTQAQIEDALAGIVRETVSIKAQQRELEARLGEPGSMCWVFVDPKSVEDEANGGLLLELCRRQGYPGVTASTLLHSYALGGPKEHLQHWTDVLDDWSLNWQKDVERSPLPLRDYNLLCVFRIKETLAKLTTIARMRPSFIEDIPATTLARLLMAMNEEYLGAAIRLGRAGLYNFRIMALGGMIPVSLKFQEFHAHQWALREGWRQTDNNFVYKIRRDGANFEFANDGHENTDQALMMPFKALQSWQAQPAWLEPFWTEEFTENFLSNTRYWVHNMKQDGCSYRLNARSQRMRYLGANPEYKVNMLAGEEESRRRLWKVNRVGKPEELPQVNSEGMAYQGYYYLRSGWKPDDYFLYFQSIGQPILSGREDNTGFSLYGKGGIFLLAPAPAVDGRTQNAHYGLIQNPGGKGNFATYGKPDVVKTGRFHADKHFDFVEGSFDGVYQYHRPDVFFDVFGSYGYEASLAKAQSRAQREGKPFVDEPIRDVRQARQILSLRDRNIYIVTDNFESIAPHHFTQNFTVYTPVRQDNLTKRLELLRQEKLPAVQIDLASQTLATRNIGLPNLQMRHFGTTPVNYTVNEDRRPEAILDAGGDMKQTQKMFSKRDRHHTDLTQVVQFSRQVAVDWKCQGSQVLVTLVVPQDSSYETSSPPIVFQELSPLKGSKNAAGFKGKLADGTIVSYLAASEAVDLDLGLVRAKASVLLLDGQRGVALNCTQIASGDFTMAPPTPDFTFQLENERVVIGAPIYSPIKPVVIEPAANVFTETLNATLSCATPDVEIRYTLDGTKPTPKSPLYTGSIPIDLTCRLKARAFRRGVTEDIWQQDGTHASVVYSAVFRKEPALAPVEPKRTMPGLKYQYFEGVWTELMVRSLTYPAKESGVVKKLLDVSPRKSDVAFGIRYEGFLEVPQDGVYTFYAPREFTFPDCDSGYDLRVFVDGMEWYPAVRWHGHGTWSIALKKGLHDFKAVFVDMRLKPHKVELMWGFPHPEFTWKGTAPELSISGPNLPKQSIPDSLLFHAD